MTKILPIPPFAHARNNSRGYFNRVLCRLDKGELAKLHHCLLLLNEWSLIIAYKLILSSVFIMNKNTYYVLPLQLVAPLFKGCLMFVPAKIADNRQQIMQLLNVTSGREDTSVTDTSPHAGYLILIRCAAAIEHEVKCPQWEGSTVRVELTAETAIVLSHIEVMVIPFLVKLKR